MKYNDMKYSGFQWIGDVPANWAIMKVKYIFTIIGGNGFPDELQGNDIGEIPFCKVSDINGTEMFVDQAQNFISMDIQKQYKFNIIPLNSIIFAKIGEALKKNHRKINSVICCIDNNTQALSILDKNRVDFKFSYYLFKIIDMKEFDNEGTIPSINNIKLKNFFVPVPSYFEQIEISSLLDKKCSNIDNIIDDLEQQIEILEKYKKSVITEAVTKGLNRDVKMKVLNVKWINSVPIHWTIKRVKHLATEKDSLFIDGDWIESDIIVDEGVRYLTTGNVGVGVLKKQGQGYISKETFRKLNCLKVIPGDLMISRLNEPIGRACIVDDEEPYYVVAVDNVVLRPNRDCDKRFLMYVMNSNGYTFEANLIARGATMPRISRTQLGNMWVPFPVDIEEQYEISSFLDKKCAEIDSIIEDKKTQIETIKKYKNSLIYEYVTGKKRVGQGDANE